MVNIITVEVSAPHKRLILDLLEVLSFDIEPVAAPAWEFFEQGQMDKLMSQCEVGSSQGLKVSKIVEYLLRQDSFIGPVRPKAHRTLL